MTQVVSAPFISVGLFTVSEGVKNVLQKNTVLSSPLIVVDSQFGVALQSTKETKPENVPWEQV